MRKIAKNILSTIALAFILAGNILILPAVSFAQTGTQSVELEEASGTQILQPGFVPLTNLPGLQEVSESDSLPNFLNQLYRLCIGAAAVIAVLQIMRAGALHMFNKGSLSTSQNVRSLIQDSVLGLLLVLSPAIVFGIINPDILDLRLNFSSLTPDALQQVDFDDLPSGQQNSCNVYSAFQTVTGRQGDETSEAGLQCPANFTKIENKSCCNIDFRGQICCGQVAATQYHIAYRHVDTNATRSCTRYNSNFVASETQCRALVDSVRNSLKAPPEGTQYSRLEMLRECQAVTSTVYTPPDLGTYPPYCAGAEPR